MTRLATFLAQSLLLALALCAVLALVLSRIAHADPVAAATSSDPNVNAIVGWIGAGLAVAAVILHLLKARTHSTLIAELSDDVDELRRLVIGAPPVAPAEPPPSPGPGKLAAVCLVLAIGGTSQLSCGAGQRVGSGATAFLDCEAPNLAPLLPDAVVLAGELLHKLIGADGTIDPARLKADAAPLKGDLGKCAWDAAIAALTTPAAATATSSPTTRSSALAAPLNATQIRAAWSATRAELGWAPAKAGI